MTEATTSAPIERLVADLRAAIIRQDRVHARRRRYRRWAAVVGIGIAGVGTAAAAGGLDVLKHTSRYDIAVRTAPAGGQFCLELRHPGVRPVYGCGHVPTQDDPFGVLVVAPQLDGAWIVYGMVADDVEAVRVAGLRVATEDRPGLDGRFFSAEVPAQRRDFVEAQASGGRIVGHAGARSAPAAAPRSAEEARAQGDPAGFAPAADPGVEFRFHGAPISPERAAAQGLSCTEDATATLECVDP
jgi:hypothetical protein